MKLIDIVEKRHSVSSFQPMRVAQADIERILDAASMAPMAHNNR